MKKLALLWVKILMVISVSAQETHQLVWRSQSDNAGASMPCGGGDIGLNVWVEKGELLIYMARSGWFDENNALLKAGRVRIKLFPDLLNGAAFSQTLDTETGSILIKASYGSQKAEILVWVDVHHPVIHIDIKGSRKIGAELVYESWRSADRVLSKKELFATSYKFAPPGPVTAFGDSIRFSGKSIVFYHANKQKTVFDYTVEKQGLQPYKEQFANPLFPSVFGGEITADGWVEHGTTTGIYAGTPFKGWRLKSGGARKQHNITVSLHGEAGTVSDWQKGLDSLQYSLPSTGKARSASIAWWKAFWKRSFVQINSVEPDALDISRNYRLFRYMLACNARGNWPTKFNGGLFTVDPVFTDTANHASPDFRNWGGGIHTAQNQRLVYYPMMKNGDIDVLEPQLNFYRNLLPAAEARSRIYWNHEGACFTEQLENFGLPNIAEYGNKRPPGYDPGMEHNAWLEYEWDTALEFGWMMLEKMCYTKQYRPGDITFVLSCLRFFDEHYQYLAAKRGSKKLDGNGKLVLYPGSAAETYKMAYNASSTIAALRATTEKLLTFPEEALTTEQRAYLNELPGRIPEIAFRSFNGHTTISPALHWERINNVESPQLYPVFPWGIFGISRPGLDTALNTWKYDTSVLKFRSHIGWKQDNIFAARLGLAKEAWELTRLKLRNGNCRFPAFWGPGYDWLPDFNWGGSGMIGLQEMLMQCVGNTLYLLPAWPKQMDVHFKFHAPYNTTVEVKWEKGRLVKLEKLPSTSPLEIILPAQLNNVP